MNSTSIRELRDLTGETQKEFAARYHIPLSTLRKWEQGSASPAPYVLEMIAQSLPTRKKDFRRLPGEGKDIFYYNKAKHLVSDRFGNYISVTEDLDAVNPHNLTLYLRELYETYYYAVEKFNRDCQYDAVDGITWV